jgi:hypothetical protein
MAKLALSMHTRSPTVRMFEEIAFQNGAKNVACPTYVSIASRNVCDNDVLRDILKSYSQYEPVSIIVLCIKSQMFTLITSYP